jgi:hypothetical protein
MYSKIGIISEVKTEKFKGSSNFFLVRHRKDKDTPTVFLPAAGWRREGIDFYNILRNHSLKEDLSIGSKIVSSVWASKFITIPVSTVLRYSAVSLDAGR